jgi:hypothetical protein
MNSRALCATVILVQLGLPSCSREIHAIHAGPGHGFASLFDGFVYVGMDVERGSHSTSGLDMPNQILPEHAYVFHHEIPFDDVGFARTILPDRLQRLGFSVTNDVDHGSMGVMDPGGNLWGVEFARAGCTGVIGTRPCDDLTSRKLFRDTRWGESDYVLRLHGQCMGRTPGDGRNATQGEPNQPNR